MSYLHTSANAKPMNDSAVPANLMDEDIQFSSSIPSFQGVRSPAVEAEVIAHEEIHLTGYTHLGNRQSQSGVPMQSLVKAKSCILLDQQTEQLMDMGFPRGLALEMGNTRSVFPVRFWVLDNSGSMMTNDGSCIRGTSSIQCTRWAELQETVSYHAGLAAALHATTVFRLLNDPGARCGSPEFCIAEEGKVVNEEVENAKRTMRLCQP